MRQATSSNVREAIRKNMASDLRSINVDATYREQQSLDDYISAKIGSHRARLMTSVNKRGEDHADEGEQICEDHEDEKVREDQGLESVKQLNNPYAIYGEQVDQYAGRLM